MLNKILTPCIGVCSTSTGDDICIGCNRTIKQIHDWGTYSEQEKICIMRDLSKNNKKDYALSGL